MADVSGAAEDEAAPGCFTSLQTYRKELVQKHSQWLWPRFLDEGLFDIAVLELLLFLRMSEQDRICCLAVQNMQIMLRALSPRSVCHQTPDTIYL